MKRSDINQLFICWIPDRRLQQLFLLEKLDIDKGGLICNGGQIETPCLIFFILEKNSFLLQTDMVGESGAAHKLRTFANA